jgi:hypothetical protein
MLYAVTCEDLCRAIFPVNRKRYRHGPFWELDPAALRVRHLQMVGDQVKLLAGHAKSRRIVDLHRRTIGGNSVNFTEICPRLTLARRFSAAG